MTVLAVEVLIIVVTVVVVTLLQGLCTTSSHVPFARHCLLCSKKPSQGTSTVELSGVSGQFVPFAGHIDAGAVVVVVVVVVLFPQGDKTGSSQVPLAKHCRLCS